MTGNGNPPDGFRAPIRQAPTRKHLVAGVPRELGGMALMLSIGVGLLLETWGAIGVFLLLYAIMFILTKQDPWWPEVWRDYLLLWLALHPTEAVVIKTLGGAVIAALLALMFFW